MPRLCWVSMVVLLVCAGCGGEPADPSLGNTDGEDSPPIDLGDEARREMEKSGYAGLKHLRVEARTGDGSNAHKAIEAGERVIEKVFEEGWKRRLARSWLTSLWPDFEFAQYMEFDEIRGAVILAPGGKGGIEFAPPPVPENPPGTLEKWCEALKGRFTDPADLRVCEASVVLAAPAQTPWARVEAALRTFESHGIWKVLFAVDRGMDKGGLWCMPTYMPFDPLPPGPPQAIALRWARVAMKDGKPRYFIGEQPFEGETEFAKALTTGSKGKLVMFPVLDPDVPFEHLLRWFESKGNPGRGPLTVWEFRLAGK